MGANLTIISRHSHVRPGSAIDKKAQEHASNKESVAGDGSLEEGVCQGGLQNENDRIGCAFHRRRPTPWQALL